MSSALEGEGTGRNDDRPDLTWIEAGMMISVFTAPKLLKIEVPPRPFSSGTAVLVLGFLACSSPAAAQHPVGYWTFDVSAS